MTVNRHSYVRFFPSDWLGGTARLTRLHKSVYFDICCYQWDKNAFCPEAELALMLGDLDDWRDRVDSLVAAGKLVRGPDGAVGNAKAGAEAARAFDLWQRKSAGGRKGAAKTNKSSPRSGEEDGNATPSPALRGKGGARRSAGGGEDCAASDARTLAFQAFGPGPSSPAQAGEGLLDGQVATPGAPAPGLPAQNQSQNRNQDEGGPSSFAPPARQWAAWIEMRRRAGKPPTPHAVALALARLETLGRQGHDPGAVLDQSTLNGWAGLFPLRADGHAGRPSGWRS